ncbi:DNA repair/transcription protein, variant [Coccidioides immitis RS]|uniref:MMS19 nucleotide excision repair protein n=4 Tax=Coccidioides immitis TaxID=5501 RepID=A0A0D8JUX4_COCIM|nr:DNA repair/transcription protein, variant [Coccidioides immitis RS]KJF60954.1 DNA repair/transcription protein, variant [Coccidioides immitis RS]KMP04447.1 hypothetical protein CIRG_04129 [Coccidioides immitis RMSCC 2394]KMU89967.1 hypothetical protein CIHG_07650 [Coccidioides immitis H538.4]TPX21052.1 hypothetical protein DIZ76_015005 [Coccidioides immitis]
MAELQEFLLLTESDKAESIRLADITAQKLVTKQATLIGVVQSLGEYINDEDSIIRGKAVSYLTAVIRALPSNFLSRQQIQVLATFYCERIEDEGAIAGLKSLQSLNRLDKNIAQLIARGLFQHGSNLQKRSQSQRFQFLQLLNELMLGHREALRDMKDESLVGMVKLMDGERDPRNLMLVFSILRVVMVEWDISGHAETLFDSVYRYFPVTFRSHPNDPYKITAQDLKDRLQDCLASNQAFASHAFPTLLDKLDSNSSNVKRDSLNALKACILSYEPSVLTRYSITIWDSLKFEILNAQEDVLAEESLQVLQSLSKRLSSHSKAGNRSFLAHYLKPILQECNEQLREPLQKQAKPAQRILASLSSVSSPAFRLISQGAIPPLLANYQNADGVSKRRGLLDALVGLFDSAITNFGTWIAAGPAETPDNPLSEFRDQLIRMFSQALMGSGKDELALLKVALRGVLQICILRDFLQDNEVGMYVQDLGDILLNKPSIERQTRQEVVGTLAEISKHKPALLINITIPAFIANLPKSNNTPTSKYLGTLENLAQVAIDQDVFYTLVTALLAKLETILTPGNSSTPAYPRSILMTILYAMDRKGLENDPHMELYYEGIVRNLCQKAALAALRDEQTSLLRDSTVLDTLGRLCNLIVRSLPHHKHQEVCDNVYRLFVEHDQFPTVPLHENSTVSQRQTMILSTYLLAGLPKNGISLTHDMAGLLRKIALLATSEDSSPIQFGLVRHLALLINKFLPTPNLEIASRILFSLMPASQEQGKATSGLIRTIFWISKAIISRLPPETPRILSSLVELLASSDPLVRGASSEGFRMLLSADDVLCTENGANIRLLAKQRVFITVVPLISEKVRALATYAGDSAVPSSGHAYRKQAYLSALSGILRTVPSSLVMTQLSVLLPLLLQSLDLTGTDSQPIRTATLETLAVVIRESGVHVIDKIGYLEDLVTRLLQAAGTTATDISRGGYNQAISNTPEARLRALQCLLILALPQPAEGGGVAKPSALLPFKNRVLIGLKCILDDPKRDVRKTAVDARMVWLKQGGDNLGNDS